MAEQEEITDPGQESFIDKNADKIHGGDNTSSSSSSPSSSDSEPEEAKKTTVTPPSPVKEKVSSLFGREKPVHKVSDGSNTADIFLWKNKKISAAVLGGVTAVWVLFELLEYHLITLVCHISILALSLLFLWSNTTIFINKRPPHIPEVHLPQDPFVGVALALRSLINHACAVMREIASGRDLKRFLVVVAGLWFISIVGSCCNFLTLFYIVFVLLHTVPVLYMKYDDKIDALAESAMIEIKKQYAVFDAKVLSKIPMGPLAKKRD